MTSSRRGATAMSHPGERSPATRPLARVNHWITAACFVLLMLSGLSMFHPLLFWLSASVRRRTVDARGPSLDRPRAGSQLCRLDRAVLARQSAGIATIFAGCAAINNVLANEEEGVPEVAALQRRPEIRVLVDGAAGPVLLLTGIVIWEVYFSTYTSIEHAAHRRAAPFPRRDRRRSSSGSSMSMRRSG